MSSRSPTLWVVATPIGNLGDISRRSREVLGAVNTILAEDTRQAGLLCQDLGLEKKSFLSLFEHNEQSRIRDVLKMLGEGKSLALVSSAGSPVISDPGYQLVRACREAGYRVSPVPGPNAPVAALMVSGLPPIPFTFLGFLPRKSGDKRRLLASFQDIVSTLVFFERKSRLIEALKLAHRELGTREACLARELTKLHEELIYLRLGEWDRIPEPLRGEFTVVIGPEGKGFRTPSSSEEVRRLFREKLIQGVPPRQAIREIQSRVQGWSNKELYALYVQLKEGNDQK